MSQKKWILVAKSVDNSTDMTISVCRTKTALKEEVMCVVRSIMDSFYGRVEPVDDIDPEKDDLDFENFRAVRLNWVKKGHYDAYWVQSIHNQEFMHIDFGPHDKSIEQIDWEEDNNPLICFGDTLVKCKSC